ncbi:MAG: M50 family metallopeptidase [Oscillospiraceae bacterium]|nr:M50 family metallopeptidase [Oscillospiraceae bacterium]
MKLLLNIDGSACILLALLCLTVPLNWLLAAVLAAAVHEAGHVLAVCLQGGRIRRLDIGLFGAVLESTKMEPLQQLVSVLAGPAGSLFLVLLARWIPRTAVCALFHGLFNLIPAEPLDGGRALRCLCSLFLDEARVERICIWTRRGIGFLLLGMLVCAGIRTGPGVILPVFLVVRLCMD